MLSDPPLTPCNLTLIKSAAADGVQIIGGERRYSLVNDSANSLDGVMDYVLEVTNKAAHPGDPTPGTARNVVIRDYIPTGMTFRGFIARNGNNVPSYFGFKFYDAKGKLIADPTCVAGITAVRSLDIPVQGDVPGGTVVTYTYSVQATLKPGASIVSMAGGLIGLKDGLSYTPGTGFHLTSDNLHFPVNDGPKDVTALVSEPATLTFPVQAVKSRSAIVDNQSFGLSIPYQVQGAEGVALSDMKMELPIPKGFQVLGAQLFNTMRNEIKKYSPGATDNTIVVSNPDAVGVRKVTFPLNGERQAFPLIKLALDPVTKSSLKNAAGQTKAPLTLRAALTGKFTKPASPAPLAAAAYGAPPPAGPPAPTPLGAASLLVSVPVQADSTKDAKIFVGRCAPVSVRRGETFSYTIFVGNLSNLMLGKGTIEMSVPVGSDFVSASTYTFNAMTDGAENGGPFGKPPARSGRKVTWSIGSFYNLEGGAVMLTVKVREDFSGTRIDDNSCIFDVVNACGKTPGPLGGVVRSGNEVTQTADIVQSAAQGLQLQ